MSTDRIQKLFANDISRRIEEVIKVDQADEAIIKDELTEYVVTDSIRAYFNEVFELYAETPRSPMKASASGYPVSLAPANPVLPRIWAWLCKTASSRAKGLGFGWPSASAIQKRRFC